MIKQVYLGIQPPRKVEIENSRYRSVFVLPHNVYGYISIYKSKTITPMPFMVGYGRSTIFFKTYGEAREYIKERFESNKF